MNYINVYGCFGNEVYSAYYDEGPYADLNWKHNESYRIWYFN